MKVVYASFLLAAVALAGCGTTGIVCSDTETRCGNTCANFQTNPDHCGSCENACPTGFVCQSAQCVCPSGFTACGQRCVNLQNSLLNCGVCGAACATGQVCESGTCTASCSSGHLECGGSCIDPATDSQNCGGCAGDGGAVCPQGQTCLSGACGSDLYAACFNSGEVYALDAKGEVASATKASAPPTNPIGLAFAGHDALEVLDTNATLYDFELTSGFGTPTPFPVGQGPNAVAISGNQAAVTNSSDGTLDLLTRAAPGWTLLCAADAGTCTASVNLGAGSFPEYAAFGQGAVYVTLQGDTFGTGDPAAGNKVVRVSLADLSTQATDLTGLDLQAPDAGTEARPSGIAYANGRVYVALQNLAGYTAGAPGLVEVLDEPNDGGALIPHGQPIKLGDGCINAGELLLSGSLLYVACGPAYDPNTYALSQPGAIAALDTTTLAPAFPPSVLDCGGAPGCQPGAVSRMALAAGKLFVGDVGNGRLFVANPQTGALTRGPQNALVLCPAPDGGFNMISDVAARP